jgi:dCTP deaminase
MNDLWKSLPPGVLPDHIIEALAAEGYLITDGFNRERLKQACYEFTVGDAIVDPLLPQENKLVPLKEGQDYILKPRCSIVALVRERIEIPADCIVRFLLKGKFFTVGIVPVNTYADPGFDGHMGIVLTNASNNYLRIIHGEPIAKAEFEKTIAPVTKPYSGQHGFETGIWPIVTQYVLSSEQLKERKIDPTSTATLTQVYGPPVAQIAGKLRYYERIVWIQIAVTILAFTILFALLGRLPAWLSILLGVVSNLLTTVGLNFLPRRWRGVLDPAP